MAYRNARLSEEMARASSLLGMGKVSHDIGNLAASMYAHLSLGEMVIEAMEGHVEGDPKARMYLEILARPSATSRRRWTGSWATRT